MGLQIGIDLGGTRIKGVLIDHDGNVIHQLISATEDDALSSWKLKVKDIVDTLCEKANLQDIHVGISAPGLPDMEHKAISFMPGRLEGLENLVWRDFLHRPTYILNDGVAALVAEARLGAAKGKQNAVMLTLGTGVGGAILINGQPYGGAFNKAGHIGHMSIDWQGDMDVTNMPGSLEVAIGNYNVSERTNGLFATTFDLVQAYKYGDKVASNYWLSSIEKLAVGIAGIANILSPEVVIIGGGVAEADDALFDPLSQFMAKYEWRPGSVSTPIVKAQCGEWAGAIGAAIFANEKSQNL
jgi:glucokinase